MKTILLIAYTWLFTSGVIIGIPLWLHITAGLIGLILAFSLLYQQERAR